MLAQMGGCRSVEIGGTSEVRMRQWLVGLMLVAAPWPVAAMQAPPDSARATRMYSVQIERYDGPTVILLEPAAARDRERFAATRALALAHGYALATDDPRGATQVWISSERWVDVPEGLVRGYVVLRPGRLPLVLTDFLPAEVLGALLDADGPPAHPVELPPMRSS
jgi:hypothetical protein